MTRAPADLARALVVVCISLADREAESGAVETPPPSHVREVMATWGLACCWEDLLHRPEQRVKLIAEGFRRALAVGLFSERNNQGLLECEAAEAGLANLKMAQDDNSLVVGELMIEIFVKPLDGFFT
jgi:hypothetical protein